LSLPQGGGGRQAPPWIVLVALVVVGALLYVWLRHGAYTGPEPPVGVSPSPSSSSATSATG
jgi:hypothetical protein